MMVTFTTMLLDFYGELVKGMTTGISAHQFSVKLHLKTIASIFSQLTKYQLFCSFYSIRKYLKAISLDS